MEVIETDEKVEVIAEPYGSASFDKLNNTVTFDFYDVVPWNVFTKVFKQIKRTATKINRQSVFESDED